MEKKEKYDLASIELIYFDSQDIITASTDTPALGSTQGGWDDSGWAW